MAWRKIPWQVILSCWKMNCEWDYVKKTVPKRPRWFFENLTAETELLVFFKFWGQFGSVQFLENPIFSLGSEHPYCRLEATQFCHWEICSVSLQFLPTVINSNHIADINDRLITSAEWLTDKFDNKHETNQSDTGQLSLDIHPWVRAMSSDYGVKALCGWLWWWYVRPIVH